MDILIYGLVDPRTNEIRYVGKTTQTLNKRLSQHLCSNKKHNPHKFNWINQLKTLNLKPTIILIESCNDKNWVEREKHYILTIENLTNITQGGENGLFFSKEIIEKISKGVKKAWSNKEFREKQSLKQKEFWSNNENRINQGLKIVGSKRTQEHKETLSTIKKNQWLNDDYKDKMVNQSKDLWNDENYKNKVFNYTKSDEHKQNVSERFKGKTLSDEHKEKMSNSSKNKKPISIEGKIYDSITKASIEIGINRDKIKGRLKSNNFKDYYYITSAVQNSKAF